jgi:hypothetical protein
MTNYLNLLENKLVLGSRLGQAGNTSIIPTKWKDEASTSLQVNNLEHKANDVLKSIIKTNASVANSQHVVYNFNKTDHRSVTLGYNHSIKIAVKFLRFFFASISCLISKPLFISSPKKIIIRISFYSGAINKTTSNNRNSKVNKFNSLFRSKNNLNLINSLKIKNKLNILTSILSKIFKKEVELQLVKLNHIYQDANILADAIGSNTTKYKFQDILKKLWANAVVKNPAIPDYRLKKINVFKTLTLKKEGDQKIINYKLFISNVKSLRHIQTGINTSSHTAQMLLKKYLELRTKNSNISNNKTNDININLIKFAPAKLTGIKIRLGGRLITERIVPKSTVQSASLGSFARGIVDNIDSANFTAKNKNGAFNVKV